MRIDKAAALIKRHVAEIVLRESRGRKLGFITITRVSLASDYSTARIYFSVLDVVDGIPGNRYDSLEGLNHAAGFIRHELAGRVSCGLPWPEDGRLDQHGAPGRRCVHQHCLAGG